MEVFVLARTNVIAFKSNPSCGRLMQMLRDVLLATWPQTVPCQYVFREITILTATRRCPLLEERAAFDARMEVFALHLTCASAQKAGLDTIAERLSVKPK